MDVLPDIKPYTPIARLNREEVLGLPDTYPIELISDLVGMMPTFIRKVTNCKNDVNGEQILSLLDQDAFSETFVPRSRIAAFLLSNPNPIEVVPLPQQPQTMLVGNTQQLLNSLPPERVNCVVTSPPYWGTRIYDSSHSVTWADGDVCPYGHEQTPESYIRHSIEILYRIKRVLSNDGSIWWNIMDTFNTRTQIRKNASEALRAMQGKEALSWGDHECRRYSAGHSYLKDGEQCGIPGRIAERASRIGLYVKSSITWTKTGTLPEPQNSRVSRGMENILHLSKQRTPFFTKEGYLRTGASLGGRSSFESAKLTDVWTMSTTSGRDGHGAQFNIALPGRCIAISTRIGDLVLDPFAGGGTTGLAALKMERRFIGFDVSKIYVEKALKLFKRAKKGINDEQRSLEFHQ